jgi:hypothetical protein
VNSRRRKHEKDGIEIIEGTGSDSPTQAQYRQRAAVSLVAPYGVEDPHAPNAKRPSLGALLVEAGIASDEQVRDAVAEGLRSGEKLGEVAVRKGWTTEVRMARLLAQQWKLRYLDAAMLSVDLEVVARLPFEELVELQVVPIALDEGGGVLAIADPNQMVFDAVRRRIGEVSYAVVTRTALDDLLQSPAFSAPLVDEENAVLPQGVALEAELFENEPAEIEPCEAPLVSESSGAFALERDQLARDGDDRAHPEAAEADAPLPQGGAHLGLSAPHAEAALASIDTATAELVSLRTEVEELARALALAFAQLAAWEVQLREAEAASTRDRETILRLESELPLRSERLKMLRKHAARLTEALDSDGAS